MGDPKDSRTLSEWAVRYANASRGGLSRKNELIAFRRSSAKYFAGLRLKKKYELDRDEITEWLQRCPTVYFTDYTGSYDDTADLIADNNPLQRLSPYLLDLAKSSSLTMAMYELEFKYMDPAVRSELASCIHPDTHVPLDMFTVRAMEVLGLEVPEDSFFGYRSFIETCRSMREVLVEKGVFARDLSTVYEFLLYVFSESR